MIVFTSKQFIDKLKWLVNDVPNYYHSENGTWCNYNKSNGKFMMDCIVSVKGLFWNFRADKSKSHGGGTIRANGVPDFSCNGALNYCSGVSTDFSKIIPGEYVCMKGTKYNHTGICMESATPTKRGKMFECTTGWETGKCIISEFDIHGNRYYKGVKNVAKWTYHGKLKWIDYSQEPKPKTQVMIWQEKMNEQWNCGLEIDGSFGPACTKEAYKHQLTYGCKAPIMNKWLQERLCHYGFSTAIDGSFGPDCKKKVIQFQKSRHLNPDAIVGPATYKALTE